MGWKSRWLSVSLRWSETRGFMERVLKRMRLDVPACAFLVSLVISLFLLQVESVFWRRPSVPADDRWPFPLSDPALLLSPFTRLSADGTKGFLWFVLAVALGNAWLLSQGIRRLGGSDLQFRKWVLVLKTILAAPPFLGLWVLPLWRALMESRPGWALRTSTPRLQLESPRSDGIVLNGASRRTVGRALDRLVFSNWFFALWMVPVNLMALRAGLAWLSVPGRQTAGVLLVLTWGRWVLRSLGFLALGYYLVKRARAQDLSWRRKLFLGLLQLCWLLPQFSPFLVTLFVYLQAERQWIQSAVRDSFSQVDSRPANSTGPAVPHESEIPAPIRWLFGSIAGREAGSEVLTKKLSFYRMKVFLLLLDAGAMAAVLEKLGKLGPWLDWPFGIGLVILSGLAALSLAVGLAARVWAFVAGPFQPASWRRERERHPAMRYAMLSGLAFAMGFLIGVPAIERDTAALTRSLIYCSAICSLQVLFLLPGILRKLMGKSEERGIGAVTWLLVFQMLGGLGEEMRKTPEVARGMTAMAHGFVVLTPLWALLLWCFRGSWLLRPFRLRDAFDSRLPRRVRWNVRWIALTAAVPMGGLAIPLWIRALRRLEAEASAAPSGSNDAAWPEPMAQSVEPATAEA